MMLCFPGIGMPLEEKYYGILGKWNKLGQGNEQVCMCVCARVHTHSDCIYRLVRV